MNRSSPAADRRRVAARSCGAKLLLLDPGREGELQYEPTIIPDGRRIDFVIFDASENTYVEVKTVNPQAKDSETGWQKYLARRDRHTENTHYIRAIG